MHHVNSEIHPPSPSLSILFAIFWEIVLEHPLLLLLSEYAATMSKGKTPYLFLQIEPFQNFDKFLQELVLSQ